MITSGVDKIKLNIRENWFDKEFFSWRLSVRQGLKGNSKHFWNANHDGMKQIHMASPSSKLS
jgi:hypothetical protein